MAGTKKNAKTDNRRADIEQILDQHGIPFKYVGLVEITEVERYKEGQSRIRDINKDLVTEYAEKMKQGAIFPPIILWSNGYEKYGIVEGNTRIAAKKKRGETSTDAYIIECEDANEAVYISAIFNATHGQKLSKEEVERAIILAGKMKTPPSRDQLAKDYGITPQKVTTIQNCEKVGNELRAIGIDTGEIPDSMLSRLASLSDIAVKRDLAQLVIDSGMKATDLLALTKEINAQGSEADRLKIVSDARTVRAAQIKAKESGRVVKHQPIAQSAMVYGRIIGLIKEFPDPKQWVPVDATRRDEYLPRVEQSARFLNQIFAAYQESIAATPTVNTDTAATAA